MSKRKSTHGAIKSLLLWLVIIVLFITIFNSFGPKQDKSAKVTYSSFIDAVDKGDITDVTIEEKSITATKKNKEKISTYMPLVDQNLLSKLMEKDVNVLVSLKRNKVYLCISLLVGSQCCF